MSCKNKKNNKGLIIGTWTEKWQRAKHRTTDPDTIANGGGVASLHLGIALIQHRLLPGQRLLQSLVGCCRLQHTQRRELMTVQNNKQICHVSAEDHTAQQANLVKYPTNFAYWLSGNYCITLLSPTSQEPAQFHSCLTLMITGILRRKKHNRRHTVLYYSFKDRLLGHPFYWNEREFTSTFYMPGSLLSVHVSLFEWTKMKVNKLERQTIERAEFLAAGGSHKAV